MAWSPAEPPRCYHCTTWVSTRETGMVTHTMASRIDQHPAKAGGVAEIFVLRHRFHP